MRLPFRGTWLLTYLFPRPEDHEACAKHPLAHPIQLQGTTKTKPTIQDLKRLWVPVSNGMRHFFRPLFLISFLGITSDYLHMQWTRSNMFFGHFYPPPPMPPTPAIGNNRPVNTTVPFEDYQLLDKETFYRRYGFPNRPVMLYNSGVEAWPAWKQWTLEALLEKVGPQRLPELIFLSYKVANSLLP